MNKTPKISVVMSVYNGEKFISSSIQSILNQTFTEFEFIIINDGSSDDTKKIIQNFMKKDERIILINHANQGLSFSLNKGISFARGKYIARMDADDISLPNRLQIQYDFMESNTDVGVCGTSALIINEKEKIISLTYHPKYDQEIKCAMLFNTAIVHGSAIIRKKILSYRSFCYSKKFINTQDYELWSHLANYTKFYNIQEPYYLYRLNKKSITANVDQNIIKNRFPYIKMIHANNLKKLGFEFNSDNLLSIFILSSRISMGFKKSDPKKIIKFLKMILHKNNMRKIYNKKLLIKLISHKYFMYLVFSKKNNFKFQYLNFFFLLGLLTSIKSFYIRYTNFLISKYLSNKALIIKNFSNSKV